MVLEAHGGGWHSGLRAATDWISKNSGAINQESTALTSLRIAQRIACSLQRENARAVLRRTVQGECDDLTFSGVVAAQIDFLTAYQ